MGLGVTEGEASPAVEIYTDGACSGNPDRAAGEHGSAPANTRRSSTAPDATTNNRMELMTAIQALEALTRSAVVRLHTDSAYLRNGITAWLGPLERERLADPKQAAGQER